MKHKIRIAGYCRESTKKQAEEGFNLSDQEKKIRKYIELYYEQESYELEMYLEKGASGKNMNRTELKRLLKDIDNQTVDVVIIHNLDRLTRNIGDLHQLLTLFEKNGIKLISVTERIDATTALGNFMVYLTGILAEFEIKNLSERTKRGVEESFNQGNFVRKAPFGYKKDKNNHGKLIVDNEEAKIVKNIFFRIIKKNQPFIRIANEYNSNNILNRHWRDDTIQKIATDKIYYGEYWWKGKLSKTQFPIIVDKQTWEKAQTIIERRGKSEKHNYIYQPIIECSQNPKHKIIGYSTINRYGTVYYYYKCCDCRKSINENEISKLAISYLDKKRLETTKEQIDSEIKKTKDKIVKIKKKIRDLEKSFVHGTVNERYYNSALMALEKERKRNEENVLVLEKYAVNPKFEKLSEDEQTNKILEHFSVIKIDFLKKQITIKVKD